jgi:hypothetical protein
MVFYTTALATDGFRLVENGNNNLFFAVYNNTTALSSSTTPAGSFQHGSWVHVVATFSSTPGVGIAIYINGVLSASNIATGTMSVATGKLLSFMVKSYSASGYVKGSLANIVFQNTSTPWTAAQILSLWQYGVVPAGATFIYALNQTSGTVATDSSGNSNNGTVANGIWSSTNFPTTLRLNA